MKVTVKALKGVFLAGGRALAAGKTAKMDESQARAYPRDELQILGPAGEAPPAETGDGDPPRWASAEAEALAAEAGLDPAAIAGTGTGGAILVDDVRAAIAARGGTADDGPKNAEPNPGAAGPA